MVNRFRRGSMPKSAEMRSRYYKQRGDKSKCVECEYAENGFCLKLNKWSNFIDKGKDECTIIGSWDKWKPILPIEYGVYRG